MICAQCRAENPDDKKYCGECGHALVSTPERPVPGEEGAFYCARHKREVTRVRCGRCDTPICPRCTVHGPAGVRCRACASNRLPIRPMGVLHEATRPFGDPQGAGRAVWYLALWAFVLSLLSGFFGGHHDS